MSLPRRSAVLAVALIVAGAMTACSSSTGQPTVAPSSLALSPSSVSASPPPSVSASASAKPPVSSQAKPGVFVFPVVGKYSYGHTHHDYPATDIITNCGNEVRAVTSGVILEVTRVDLYKAKVNAGATRGGLSVSIKGDDGLRYYGSHMEEINTNIQPGVRVTVGEPLGKVGRTGDASACHLHFGISPLCAGTGDWWNQRGVIWPWPYLDSWKAGGNKSPVAAINAWKSKNGCPTKPQTDP